MMGGVLCWLYWSEALEGVKREMMGGRKGSREREKWGMIEGEREQGWERTGSSTMKLDDDTVCVETRLSV